MTLDILAIAAHPGEAEASCGGTLLRMAERGYRTGILDLTAGAAPEFAVAWRESLNLPSGRLENSLAARLTIAVRIRELRPRVVILPYWESTDPDQVHGCALAAEACFLAGQPELEEYSERHRVDRILYASFFSEVRPSFVVDVSKQFARRPAGEDRERVEVLGRFHGSRIGVRYGEPYVMKEALALGDIVQV